MSRSFPEREPYFAVQVAAIILMLVAMSWGIFVMPAPIEPACASPPAIVPVDPALPVVPAEPVVPEPVVPEPVVPEPVVPDEPEPVAPPIDEPIEPDDAPALNFPVTSTW